MQQKVYDFLTTIPRGKVVTYKQIAEFLGNAKLARVVGTILHKNPNPEKYPCFRVVNSKGKLARNFAFGGIDTQRQLLIADGIIVENYRVDLNKYQFLPN